MADYQKREGLYEKVYEIVRTIPRGKVATYGQIAKLLGTRDPRKVGWALAANSDSKTPCHRVVNKEGELAKNFGKSLDSTPGWETQKALLQSEGVTFTDEKTVHLPVHQWEK